MGGKERLQSWTCSHVHTGTHVEVGMDEERETTQEAATRAVGGWEGGRGGKKGEEGEKRKERESGGQLQRYMYMFIRG